MKRFPFVALLAVVSVSTLFIATSAIAADPAVGYAVPKLQIDIPGVDFDVPDFDGTKLSVNFLGAYVSGVYRYLIGFALTIAIVMIMVGGLQYVLGASSGDVKKGKKRMTDAIEGFVLLMFVFVILYSVNPETTLFKGLDITVIPEVPEDSLFESFGLDATTDTATGSALFGHSKYQDCMLKKYGSSASEVKLVDVPFSYLGHTRTYRFNEAGAADLKKAFDAIIASGVNYDITRDTAGSTVSWRANRNDKTVLSNHSWGTAIDINPDKNPNCPSGCFDGDDSTACRCVTSSDCKAICESRKGDLPDAVVKAFINNNFDWLGDRQTAAKPNRMIDIMHFDWNAGCY